MSFLITGANGLIGCDLAGGNWKKYYVALSTWAELNNITVVLYDINNKGV